MLDRLNDLRTLNERFQPALGRVVERVVASGWYSLGPEVEAFEHEFASYCGARHAVGVANGTDALELALRSVGLAAGESAITAANAGAYAAHAIRAIGATPVFADVDERRLGIDPDDAAARIDDRTRAIVVTHLHGRMADVEALRSLAERRGLALVEDCAQAHGAVRTGVRAGAWGDAAAFSFYPTKNLGALGDAGVVLARDADVAERVRALRQYGWRRKYESELTGGRNSRLDELQAAVLRVKLPLLDALNAERRAVARAWAAGLPRERIECPDVEGEDYVAHLFVVRTARREAFRAFLGAHAIASDIHYPYLDYEQPALAVFAPPAPLPVSGRVRSRLVTLPCHPGVDVDEVRRACDRIHEWSG